MWIIVCIEWVSVCSWCFSFLNSLSNSCPRMHMFIDYCFTVHALFPSAHICAHTHWWSYIYMCQGSGMRRALAALLLALPRGLVADGMVESRDRQREGWIEWEDRGEYIYWAEPGTAGGEERLICLVSVSCQLLLVIKSRLLSDRAGRTTRPASGALRLQVTAPYLLADCLHAPNPSDVGVSISL